MEENKTPFNFEQACNFINEKHEKAESEIKKTNFPISLAMPEDRKFKLKQSITLLKRASFQACMAIPIAGYSAAGIANMLRTLLNLRVDGYSINSIAKHFGVPPDVVSKLEKIGMEEVKRAIEGNNRIISLGVN